MHTHTHTLSHTHTQVFNTVMPKWLDLLTELRSEPGKMENLRDQFQLIFCSYKNHDEGLKTYRFIMDRFRSRDSLGRQRALLWLQVGVWEERGGEGMGGEDV